MFNTILVANRGEIACRVMRTARRLGIRTIAIYSEPDAGAMHVAMADAAYCVGPAAARESYLNLERIIAVARESDAQAIHPGYGFLSENEEFAAACERAGVVFIGPPASAIRAMGSKSAAKKIMEDAGVPLVPGFHGDEQDAATLIAHADRIGYPVLLKPSAGGGGKGMRVVQSRNEFNDALAGCKREALAAFGDDKVLIERYLTRPRHIEIQVFADRHGNCVHLFERDCSVQRRHQKVLEEAPAPAMTPERRAQMGAAAVAAARAIGYVNAGTVEFIVDERGTFHFMEMNTRLQVEHPVTEMITGLDLVEWQLRVAAGESLPCTQEQLRIDGHALEARIYAEDPDKGFLPATGRISYLGSPDESRHVRIDTGIRAGDAISPYYDPMIAKLIVWDHDRNAAIARMQRALSQFQVVGLTTNVGFLKRLAAAPAFAAAQLDTGFIEHNQATLFPAAAATPHEALALASLAELLSHDEASSRVRGRGADPYSPWQRVDGWRLNQDNHHAIAFRMGESTAGDDLTVVAHYRDGGYEVELPGAGRRLTLHGTREGDTYTAMLDARTLRGTVVATGARRDVFLDGVQYSLELVDPYAHDFDDNPGAGSLAPPMPGKGTAVLVEPGAIVERGTPLLIMEAMKMEHTIHAPAAGTIGEILYKVGEQVPEGAELLVLDRAAK